LIGRISLGQQAGHQGTDPGNKCCRVLSLWQETEDFLEAKLLKDLGP